MKIASPDFCPSLIELLNADRVVGRTGKVFGRDLLASNSTRNNLTVITRLMLDRKPERTLEIGFALGASALAFTDAHRKLGHQGANHVAIDAWEVDGWDAVGLQNVQTAGLSEHLDFRGAVSAVELARLLDAGDKFGMIYVDGSHEFDDVFVDTYYCIRLLTVGGLMLLDDSPHPPVAKVVNLLRKDKRLVEFDLSAYRDSAGLIYAAARILGRVQLTAFALR